MTTKTIRVGIFYHADPLGHVPSGIDTFIGSLIKWAPEDLHYTLFGASSDVHARPLGKEIPLEFAGSLASFVPLISSEATSRQNRIPLTLQYMWALRSRLKGPAIKTLHVLDFHRIEPVLLFWNDTRPKNVFIHNDMAMTRDKGSDMRWRYAPWLYEQIEGRLFRRVSRVLAVRQTAVDRYRKTYPALASRFTFTPTSVDTETFQPAANHDLPGLRNNFRTRLGVSESARLLVFVGRLDLQKDPILLLQAFAKTAQPTPDVHLVIVGDGTLRSAVESAIQSMQLVGRVTLLGVQPRTEIAKILQASDLFVLSSAYEGMPIAMLEALTTGVPVVSTDVGEVGTIVRNGRNGYISPARTAEALSNTFTTALNGLRNISGAACVQSVQPYRPEQVFGTIYNYYRAQALLGSANASAAGHSIGALPS
jgi:glycosyltransferase involved in cell wall biosynthesis